MPIHTILSVDEAFEAVRNLPLFHAALEAIAVLEKAGFSTYIVGGFVRDAFLARTIHDADLACNAPYDELVSLFQNQGFYVHKSGEKHGTATVIVQDFPLEITRFRQDGSYTDLRHPENISFVETIEQDLARRDFTINAMAFNPHAGLVDPFGGRIDLKAGIIRCVGCPKERFDEDALRILRALRFGSQLDFKLDSSTEQAVRNCALNLCAVSAERLFSELTLLLCGANPYDFLMHYHDIIDVLIPELSPAWKFNQKTPYHIYDVYDHIAHCVQAIDNTPLDRWVALLHDVGKPASFAPDETGRGHFPGHAKASKRMAHDISKRYKMPRAFSDDLLLLIERHDDVIEETPRAVKRMLRKLDGRNDLFAHLCAMKRADTLSQAPQCAGRLKMVAHLEKILDEVLEQDAVFQVHDLAVNGNDLIAAGLTPGPVFRELLDAALDAVVDERIENSSEEIWKFWKEEGYLEK